MQYALDTNGSWANAKLTEYKKHSQFFCGCAERHNVKLVKPSGVLGKRPFSDYFAHVSKKFKSSDTQHVCMSMSRSGESTDHFNAKHMLREMVGRYTFTTFRCTSCLRAENMTTSGCEVSIERTSTDGRWRYDCLLTRGRVDIAALEVVHSHKVSVEKADAVRASGLEIAEFRAEDILKLLSVQPTNTVHLENLLVKLGKCQNCLVNAWFVWHRLCLEEELRELIRQDEAIAVHYNNIHEHGAIMQIIPVIDRCQGLLMFHLRRGVHIEIPGVGDVICHKAHKWTHGILVTRFSSSCRIATWKLCIVLFDGVECDIERKYPHPNFHRKFHIFLHCSTVLHRLGHYTGSDKREFVFKDCRWPILKKFESSNKICANCGKRGHVSDNCYERFCVRCGRNGHVREGCYARSNNLGNNYVKLF